MHKVLRISWLFRIFGYSPENKVWRPKRGKFQNIDAVKVQNISEIHPTLGFTEFDILEKYRKSFHESELGIRRPRNKYSDVAKSYLSYNKKRKRKASRDKDAQAPHDQAPWKAPHTERWDS